MSTTRNGPVAGSSSPTAPAKDSSASSSPVITSGSWPSVERTISVKSSRFAASRVAEVATIRVRTAPEARDHRRVVGQRPPGAVQRMAGQPAGGVDALAEPDHPHLPVHVDQLRGAVRIAGDVGDQQPDRIRAAVDGGDPHRRARVIGRPQISVGRDRLGLGRTRYGRVGHDRTVPQQPSSTPRRPRPCHPTHCASATRFRPLVGYDVSRRRSGAARRARRRRDGPRPPELRSLAVDAGSAEIIEAVRLADTNPPVLRTHDRAGHRIDEVDYHPAWHTLMARAVGAGLQAAPWAPDAGTAGPPAPRGRLLPVDADRIRAPVPDLDDLLGGPRAAAQPGRWPAQYEPGLRSRTYDFGLRPRGGQSAACWPGCR